MKSGFKGVEGEAQEYRGALCTRDGEAGQNPKSRIIERMKPAQVGSKADLASSPHVTI